MNKKLEQSAKKYFKKPKTEIKSDKLKKLENSLLALKIFGSLIKIEIPFEVPEDETRLSELELIFTRDHENVKGADYEKEAEELLARYNKELNTQKIKELNEKLDHLDEDSDEYENILKEIIELQK